MLSSATYGSHVLLWPFTSPHITVFRVVGQGSGLKFCTLSSPAADRIGGTYMLRIWRWWSPPISTRTASVVVSVEAVVLRSILV